jgi:aldehyde dehydrogenase (NAD+)
MHPILSKLNIESVNPGAWAGGPVGGSDGTTLESTSPTDGSVLASVRLAGAQEYETVVERARERFLAWRTLPAPKRGELVRLMGNKLREHKAELGALVSLEAGKIRSEGEGEIQEMIDIADFAVGLSRQLYGLTMQSERPGHRMFEQWHPLGPIGVITSFNFPAAVWAWNSFIAAVCGDTVVWKPSSKTPLVAIAIHRLMNEVLEAEGWEGVFGLVVGRGSTIGDTLVEDPRLPLISATGSCRVGRRVGTKVAERFGRSILELGGNNAIIVLDDADLELAVRGIAFGAVGTAGQRCTTTRRVLAQRGIASRLADALVKAYASLSERIGDPMEDSTLVGPLIDEAAVRSFEHAVAQAQEEGAEVLHGGRSLERPGFYVEPTLLRAPTGLPIAREETFAPILYLMEVDSLEEAIAAQNAVDQGLSSAIFTDSVRASNLFLSAAGSDCGIANVNIGTSGAEIGGAFGGEKETGGGREAGSDSWKAYMRRQTCTVNWSGTMPLAQGVEFDV